MKSKTMKTSVKIFALIALSLIMAAAIVLPNVLTARGAEYYNSFLHDAPYNTDFSSIQEVADASAKVANQISAEGTVLLKNDGALPLTGEMKVSLFGTSNDKLNQMASGLENQGFGVNTNAAISANLGNIVGDAEKTESLPRNYSDDVKQKNEILYNDAAIIMFDQAFGSVSGENSGFGFIANAPVKKAEGGGKGPGAEVEGTGNGITDPQDASVEDFKDYHGNPYLLPSGGEFKQKNLAHTIYDNKEKRFVTVYETGYNLEEKLDDGETDRYTVEYYKHPLMLSEAAEELVAYATDNFDTVVVVFMSANQLEAGILEQDPGVSAVIWSGDRNSNTKPDGRNNIHQIAKIITGEVNPSGRTINTWARDFTSDPTWANDGNSGVTYASVDGKDATEWEKARIFHGSSYAMGLRHDGEQFEDKIDRYYIRAMRTNNNKRKNALPVMYEEDIYMGYRYYETYAADKGRNDEGTGEGDVWYDDAVVYPFGHGLSYTTFEKEIVDVEDADWDKLPSVSTNDKDFDGKITLSVKVTNTGDVAGKEVVQVYGHAPYIDGEVEKSEVTLVGFEKTRLLAPGTSQTVKVSVKIRDLASFDWDDANGNDYSSYELDAGTYELRLQDNSHDVVATETFELDSDVILNHSPATGKEITPVLSTGNSLEDTLSYDPETKQNMVDDGKMTLMSRATAESGFDGTFPEPSKPEDMVRSEKYFTLLDASNDFNANSFYTSNELLVEQTTNGYNVKKQDADGNYPSKTYPNTTSSQTKPVDKSYYELLREYGMVDASAAADSEDNSGLPWAVTKDEFMDITGDGEKTSWKQADPAKQAADKEAAGEDWILFYEMKGVDPDGTEKLAEFGNKTGAQVWTEFMNQLTFDELKTIILWGGFNTASIDSIELPNSRHCDDMMGLSRQGVHTKLRIQFGDSPVNAATWNKQLQYERGRMVAECGLWSGVTGWYAVSGNLHRSAWGGRNPEYYGEDPYLIGHISGCHGAGAESKGLITYAKHNAFNENETGRYNRHTYASEQAAREIYFKAFQICLQDYQLRGTMTSYNNIGDRQSASHHAYQWEIIREEWGYKGLSLTDAVTPKELSYTSDMMVRAGGSQLLANVTSETGDTAFYDILGGTYDTVNNKVTVEKRAVKEGYEAGKADTYELEVVDQVDSYTQWYYVRMGAMHTLYAYANSATADRAMYDLNVGEGNEGTGNPYPNENAPDVNLNEKYAGVSFTVGVPLPTGEDAISVAPPKMPNVAEGTEYTYILGDISIGSGKSATWEQSKLPAGITLDEKTGTLSGTPTEAGTIEFCIWGGNLQGGWVRNIQTFEITINDPTALAAPANVSVDADGVVTWDAVANASGYEITLDGYGTYTVSADKTSYNLPLMSEGTYGVTVKALGSGLYGDSAATAAEFVATGEAGKSAYELAVENGFEGTLEEWLDSLKGADGAPGEKGDKGDKGDPAEGGCGSAVGAGTAAAITAIAVIGLAAVSFIAKRARKDK